MNDVNAPQLSTMHAYIDESGAKGLLRNLTPARDDEIAVAAAVLIPEVLALQIRTLLEIPYNMLKSATPPHEKLHITDAFSSTNTYWRNAADAARSDIEQVIMNNNLQVIYAARRLGVSRRSFAMTQTIVDSARDLQKTSNPNIRHSNHPPDDRVEAEVFSYLFLKLDAIGKETKHHIIPHIDNTTDAIFNQYIERLEDGRTLAQNTSTHSAYDLSNKQKVHGSISFKVHMGDGMPVAQLNTTHVIDPTVESDVTPEILAADVVANTLFYHLRQLQAPLNSPSSIDGWNLASLVAGMVPNDNFDLF